MDGDKDRDTHTSSPTMLSTGGRQRRHSHCWCRVWMPLPQFAGLGHSINPILYPLQLNFPPLPVIAPILLRAPPSISHAFPTSGCPCSPSSSGCPCSPSSSSNSSSSSPGMGQHSEYPSTCCSAGREPCWSSSGPCSGCRGCTKSYATSTPGIYSRQRFCS